MHYRVIFWTFVSIIITACSTFSPTPDYIQKKESKLYHILIAQNRSISKKEARQVATEAINYSIFLSHKYNADTSPWVHNFLVNIGLRDRGLCYQWAGDLYNHLQKLHLKTIKFIPVGANIGKLNEHNSIAAFPVNTSKLKYGILLDAWRRSGDLYFIPIQKDQEYRWYIRHDLIMNPKSRV